MCDLENLKNEEVMTCVGLQRHKKKSSVKYCQQVEVLCYFAGMAY
jgi:hypothetical protein